MSVYTSTAKTYSGTGGSISFQTKTTYTTSNLSSTTTKIDFSTLAQVMTSRIGSTNPWDLVFGGSSSDQMYVEVTINGVSSKASSSNMVSYDSSNIANTNSFTTFLTSSGSSTTITRGSSSKTVTATVKLYVPGMILRYCNYATQTSSSTYTNVVNTGMSSALSYTFSITIPAADAWTVSYNANGGSGAPSSQTKQYGTTLVLSSTIPTRTGYTFSGWATSANGSVAYQPGGSYTGNAALSLYAVWTANSFTVAFLPNFPNDSPSTSGTMGTESFTYATTKQLTSCAFSAQEYAFAGWATSESGQPTYADNADGCMISTENGASVTLYAVWTCTHVAPAISGVSVQRCDSGGTLSDDGTMAKVAATCTVNDSDYSGGTLRISFKESGTSSTPTVRTYQVTGTSTSTSKVLPDSFDVEKSYEFIISFTDGFGASASTSEILTQAYFTMDVMTGGHGISFGAPCQSDGFHVAMPVDFSDPLQPSSGGTGQTSLQATRNAMGLGNTTGALPVKNGGTGATSASDARTNLGAAASSHSHSYLPLSGGTIIGDVALKNSTIDMDGSNPSSTQTSNQIVFKDKDGESIGYIRVQRGTSGQMTLQLFPYNKKSDGTYVSNALGITVTKNGTCAYSIRSAENFRSAIGMSYYVSASGTSNSWYYVKFSNNYAIAWRSLSVSCSALNAWGSTYYTEFSTQYTLPFTFSAAPTISIELEGSNGNYWITTKYSTISTTKTPTFYAISPGKVSSGQTCRLNMIVAGVVA